MKTSHSLVALSSFLVNLWAATSAAQETWNLATVTDVDTGLSVHYSDTAIVTDSTGGVHISYRNPSPYLAYATNSSGIWQTGTLLVDWPGSGRENDIVLDSSERLHVSSSSRDGSGENLYHLYQDAGGTWHQELVYGTGSVGMENSVAVDATDTLHISHWAYTGTALYHSTGQADSWSTSILGSASWDRTAVAVDIDGVYQIVYRLNSQLWHLDTSASTLITAVIGPSGPSVTIDADGHLHVSYGNGAALQYATNASGSWRTESVDATAAPGRHHSIAVDADSNVHISYRDEVLDALRYAHNLEGGWTAQVVDDSADDVGYSNAIAVDADGAVHISYRWHTLDALGAKDTQTTDPMTLADIGWKMVSAAKLRYATTDLCRGNDATGDTDADGICDDLDLCLGDDLTGDQDGDMVCDDIDNCPAQSNPDQADQDLDGIGDVCDVDRDGDGVIDGDDNCPDDANADQADLDEDGMGDVCDPDDDGDGIDDVVDNCPVNPNSDQADLDLDGQGDVCDLDDDGDGMDDVNDNCPVVANPDQADQDQDGVGNVCDACQGPTGTDPATSAQASISFLAGFMDAYHHRFPVYYDVSSAGNHFIAYGKIPDETAAASSNGSWTDDLQSGATAIRCEFEDVPGDNFGGFYFLNGTLTGNERLPVPNFGEQPNAGIDLSDAVMLTFWVKGETGDEIIDFFFAGVGYDPETGVQTALFPGSEHRYPPLGEGYVPLTNGWQEINIPISGLDLSYVLGGFAWSANDVDNPDGAVFYIDNIYYTLSVAGEEARLNDPRFIQSYETLPLQPDPTDSNKDDDIDFVLRNLAFSYDNSLALLAFLADGSADTLRRARLIGDAFVYASLNDRFFDDGRIRTAYAAGDLVLPPGWAPNGRTGTAAIPGYFYEPTLEFFEVGQGHVDVGNNSWVMIALLALYEATGEISYLDAARRVGDFVRTFKNETGTYRGFQGGIDWPENPDDMTPRLWASGEHNLDVYAAFSRMAKLTDEASWTPDAAHAQAFVESLWGPVLGCYFAGTVDPENRNEGYGQLPLDVQTWSVLSLPDVLALHPEIFACIETHHRATDEGFSGYDFNTDKDAVWFEGTAQSALAYLLAGQPSLAEPIQAELQCAQTTLPFGDGSAIVATTREGLTTGFDFKYFRRFHIATAAWNVFAQLGFNPYYACLGLNDLVLTDVTVDSTVVYQACTSITAGGGFHVLPPGDVTLRAGSRVALGSGFSVGLGATLTIEIAPPW